MKHKGRFNTRAAITVILMALGIHGQLIAAGGDVVTGTNKLKGAVVQPKGTVVQPKGVLKTLRAAELTNLEIGTESDGRWFWIATVKNIGNTAINKTEMKVQGVQIQFAPAMNPDKPGSGSLLTQNIVPNQSISIKRYWTRCCHTDQLRVDLWDIPRNLVVDSKTISHLIHNIGYGTRIFNYKVSNITWNDTAKTWTATIQNNTPYSLKVVIQADVLPGGQGAPKPAGGRRILLPPNTSITTPPIRQSTLQHGDKLRVGIRFDSDNNFCQQAPDDCGKGYWITTLPNSQNF